MHRGYVQLWRRSLGSEAWRDPKLWRLWTYCLLKASHRTHRVVVGRRAVELLPGQFVLTRRNAAADTGLTQAEVRSLLSLAEGLGMIARAPSSRCTVISIVNWGRYQQVPPARSPQSAASQPAPRPSTSQEEHDPAQLRDFGAFWAAYPRKMGRKAALEAWLAAEARPPLDELLAALSEQAVSAQWRREEGRFIPAPATWLAQARWSDRPGPAAGRESGLLAWAREGEK
jgi:hypothetical protein